MSEPLLPPQGAKPPDGGINGLERRPKSQRQIWVIRFFLDREGRMRDRALFDLAIDSKLRSCDLVNMS
ncbi:hypothetical protein GFM02_33835 [Rhizobium leguminosarum bv. viciae]|nr:hypothetical protein [Rhizobium leguminosarum bv. viciae]